MDPFVKKMIQGSVAFLAVMLLMLGALSVVYFHTHRRCTEQVLAEVPSPDGQWTASIMRRRCGEEAPFLVHVNLRSGGSPPAFGFFSGRDEEGQVFVAEQDMPEIVPDLTWISSTGLRIACPSCREARKQERWRTVDVQ
jgi:hypothetical protein